MFRLRLFFIFFFFNDTATTEIYTLSLHDASSDLDAVVQVQGVRHAEERHAQHHPCERDDTWDAWWMALGLRDRKSTRLNSSHGYISYAVFCLKKKTSNARATGCSPTP